MARMKFICDSERCIECNACATACKNEHEVPWGVNRRRVVTINDGMVGAEKSISVACMHSVIWPRGSIRLAMLYCSIRAPRSMPMWRDWRKRFLTWSGSPLNWHESRRLGCLKNKRTPKSHAGPASRRSGSNPTH